MYDETYTLDNITLPVRWRHKNEGYWVLGSGRYSLYSRFEFNSLSNVLWTLSEILIVPVVLFVCLFIIVVVVFFVFLFIPFDSVGFRWIPLYY